MLLPCDSNGAAAAAGEHTPRLTNYEVSLSERLLDKPRRPDWLRQVSFCRGEAGDPSSSGGSVAVDWSSVRSTCEEWIKNPMNIALLLWLLCVGVSGGMLVLLLLGFLDGAFPAAAAARNHWVEVNNQVLNALFTLMSIYQHPAICHHLFLLCRWRLPGDAAELRAAYCTKNGSAGGPRPGERAHMAVVLVLLHLTVACQYVLCWLYWGYTRSSRPELMEDGFYALGVAAPVVAVVYIVCSPLGKEPCGELVACSDATSVTERSTAAHVVVVEPEWAGGMFDCGGGGAGDAAAGWWCLSLSCTFCVFGWNAERLGFGNACVHAATFALLCFAPVCVFGVSALHVHDVAIGDAVGVAGVLLCACGLLYGGYWRIQMRRRFGLPGSAVCCGSSSATDYARWLFCWPCALAQEVRTASLYVIDGESFFHRKTVHDDDGEPLLPSRHRAESAIAPGTTATPASDDLDGSSRSDDHLVVVVHDEMVPPAVQVVVVRTEDDHDTCEEEEHNAVGDEEKIESLVLPTQAIDVEEEDGSYFSTSNQESVEHVEQRLSDGSWRVERMKRLINVVTMVSLLILLYTRGFIR